MQTRKIRLVWSGKSPHPQVAVDEPESRAMPEKQHSNPRHSRAHSSKSVPSVCRLSGLRPRAAQSQRAGAVSASRRPLVVSTWNHGLAANDAAWAILAHGGRALDAVESGVRVTEADPAVDSSATVVFPTATVM